MAIGVLILGESGTGKTYSAHNFKPDEVKILSVKKPILPFRGDFELVKTSTGDDIIRELKNTNKKRIIIDDFQYILGVQMMKRVAEKGWDKFNEIQKPYADVLEAIDSLPDDVIVYFNSHIQQDESGKKKIKTIGKALDNYLTVEGLFMIVLGTLVVDGKYYFTTQNNGSDTVKSPMGMFPSYTIDNDLKYVDEKIRNYYHIGEFLTDEEIAAIDETVKNDEIPIKEEKKPRRSRGGKKEEEPKETPVEEEKEEKPKRRSRREKEHEEIAESGFLDDADDTPFNEEEELPQRKDRSEEPKTEGSGSKAAETEEKEEVKTTDGSNETPTRRRRRRN
jgi:hypothetical protein